MGITELTTGVQILEKVPIFKIFSYFCLRKKNNTDYGTDM